MSEHQEALAQALWEAIVTVRDASPRLPDDADSWDIVNAVMPFIELPMREAAWWVGDKLGYPIDFTTETPMPQSLWDALVDHVAKDHEGQWHGNELDREETESWLADEAGRELP